MSAVHTPVKTQAGQDELSRRALGLSQRHRTVLLLVDGRRSEQQVIEMARQAGVADGLYAELVSLGLIQVQVPAEAAPSEVDIPLNDSTPPSDLDSDSAFDSAQLEAASAFIEEDPGLEAAREVLLRALRIDAPVNKKIDELRWQGPSAAFPATTRKIGDDRLLKRLEKLKP